MGDRLILGITGTYSAGKDTLANYLVKTKGFTHHSLSDIIRDVAKERGVEQTRDNWIKIGNDLRSQFGVGELSKRLVKKIKANDEHKVVVTSIRNPGEIEAFREVTKDFYMLALDAPIELRYERARERGNLADDVSFEKFKNMEEQEMATSGAGQQLGVCMSMADQTIVNDGDLGSLHVKVEKILEQLKT